MSDDKAADKATEKAAKKTTVKVKRIVSQIDAKIGETENHYGIALTHVIDDDTLPIADQVHSLVAEVEQLLVQSLIDAKLLIKA